MQPPQLLAAKGRPHHPEPYCQALVIQRILFATIQNPKLAARDQAQVARAWREIEELKRDIKMKPKPKPIDVSPEAIEKRMRRINGRTALAAPIELAPPAAEPYQPESPKAEPITADQPAAPQQPKTWGLMLKEKP
jgi:hypothetical protein